MCIRDRNRSGDRGVYLKGNLGAIFIDPRTNCQFDSRSHVSEVNRAYIILNEFGVGNGNLFRNIDVGHSIIERQYAWTRHNLSGAVLNESFQAHVKLAEDVADGRIQLSGTGCRIGDASNYQTAVGVCSVELVLNEIGI